MTEYLNLVVLAGFLFLYSVIASRLERSIVNGALVYVGFGLLCGPAGIGILELDVGGSGLRQLAELTLALVLFVDAANANIGALRGRGTVPARLLMLGLPLTILAGIGFGAVLFDGLDLLAIALLATMVAPTDAALSKGVVTNEAVPESVRESLNVESGLNDGICVPVLLVLLAAATQGSESIEALGRIPVQAIAVGVLVGFGLGGVGAFTLRKLSSRGWVTASWIQVPVVGLAVTCFAAAELLGGSGFIACFLGGLVFGRIEHKDKLRVLRAAEGTGDTLALLTWVVFGATIVGEVFEHLSWQTVVYRSVQSDFGARDSGPAEPHGGGHAHGHAVVSRLVRAAGAREHRVRCDRRQRAHSGRGGIDHNRDADRHFQRRGARSVCKPAGAAVWRTYAGPRRRALIAD